MDTALSGVTHAALLYLLDLSTLQRTVPCSELSAAVTLTMAGREPGAAAPADMLLVATPAATCSLWAPPSEQLPALGPAFFSLADACLLAYDPHPVLAGQASASTQLERLAGVCRQVRPVLGKQGRLESSVQVPAW